MNIRGVFGVDFEPKDFYQIACAYASCFQPETIALGHDVRESSPQLWQAVAEGLQDSGVDVLNLGCISTDMLYFAVGHYQTDGGIVITASHNQAAFNGMKLVRQHAAPVSADTGLFAVRDAIENGTRFKKQNGSRRGSLWSPLFLKTYFAHLRSICKFAAVVQKSDCDQCEQWTCRAGC